LICSQNEGKFVRSNFPIQAFLDHGILDLSLINRFDNLRPIIGPENLSKADKYDETDFKQWLKLK